MRPWLSQNRLKVVNSLCFSFCAQSLAELFIAEMNSLVVENSVAIADILHYSLKFSGLEESLHIFRIVSESLIMWFLGVKITNIAYTDVYHQFCHAKYQDEDTIKTHIAIHHYKCEKCKTDRLVFSQ